MKKLSSCNSPNGNGAKFWIAQTIWEVRHSTDAVQDKSLLNLRAFAESIGVCLVTDQLNELYKKIVFRVEQAGRAKWKANPENKKIKKEDFIDWTKNLVASASNPSSGGTGDQLKQKMSFAGIASDVIQIAQEQRRTYKSQIISSAYLDLSEREKLEAEIQANLNQLLSQLDAEEIDDSGVKYHSLCLSKLDQVRLSLQGQPSLSSLQGYMYNLVDRCVYRFSRGTK